MSIIKMIPELDDEGGESALFLFCSGGNCGPMIGLENFPVDTLVGLVSPAALSGNLPFALMVML